MANTADDLPVFADERQSRIAELVTARGRVHNSELTDLFGVTETTIRKDLSALQQRGILKRTHGGAIAVRSQVERELIERSSHQREAKERIALRCLAEIKDGDAIFVDSGTTNQAIAEALAARGPTGGPWHLSVLTSSVNVAEAVADIPTFAHILLGGRLRRVAGSVVGGLAIENLDRFTVNVAFIGISGFSAAGITVADIEEAELKAAVIERARHVVVPADHTKLGATHFAKVCELADIDALITDEAVSDEVRQLCADHEVRVVEATQALASA